jgi:hypothetical protein
MRPRELLWLALPLVVSLGYGAALLSSWDPGATSFERDRMPTAAGRGRSHYFTYWSTGFGGK